MNVLKLSEPHFIRCVKPNHDKAADSFQDELVTKQLRYTGMLETTRIRREGCVFPSSLALIYYCTWLGPAIYLFKVRVQYSWN